MQTIQLFTLWRSLLMLPFLAIQNAFTKDKLVLNPEETNYMVFTRKQMDDVLDLTIKTKNGTKSKRVINIWV